jgi:hypothetical protein
MAMMLDLFVLMKVNRLAHSARRSARVRFAIPEYCHAGGSDRRVEVAYFNYHDMILDILCIGDDDARSRYR